jgi:hypothetical protein
MKNEKKKTKQQSLTTFKSGVVANPEDGKKALETLKLCALADKRFDYQDAQLVFWADRIMKMFPRLGMDQLQEIVCKGLEGKWRDKFNPTVNLSTVIQWIENERKEINDRIAAAKEKQYDHDRGVAFEQEISIEEAIALRKMGERSRAESQEE